VVRIAAAGDVHASEATRGRIAQAFAQVEQDADIVLLAGDLTTLGEPKQAAVLADACRGLSIPVCAILGNHDLHSGHGEEVSAILRDAGVNMLERSFAVYDIDGTKVGVAGAKGFVGGFPGSETTAEVDAIAHGLEEIAHCRIRIVLLHYSPVSETLHGEPEGIWTYLGCDRLAVPIAEYRPDVVVHGHAHAGSFEGSIGPVPVYNVAVHVTGRDFYVFDVEGHKVEVEPRVI
jgi:Icc-related predicted phosphoesterase